MKKLILLFLYYLVAQVVSAQQKIMPTQPYISKVWSPDLGNGQYKNPVINADYSDPDVIRVGSDFYLVSSSFENIPGLPILHSKDLVNWKILGYALNKQPPFEHFDTPRHGDGVWAPAIRYYNKQFYIYYPDPDFGIYLTKATDPAGPWTDPVLVMPGKGLIDPCPLLDDDGSMYLVHGFAGSRAGIKSVIAINKLNKAGTKVTDEGMIVYDGHEHDPTLEGPKFYKRNGYYYIFAPAGGVSTGWQLALRSNNIYGPYERRVVMDQGKSPINGPHQGAWVNTSTGEDWFIHFQDKDAYGRVVHLEPMIWKDNWPVIGLEKDGDGKGEPVLTYRKPNVGKLPAVVENPIESDDFNTNQLGLQWQWNANPKAHWSYLYPAKGVLRLYSARVPDETKNLWQVPNLLMQKFPAEEFIATVKLEFTPNTKLEGEKAGLAVMGLSYAGIGIKHKKDGDYLVFSTCKSADRGGGENERELAKLSSSTIYLRVIVQPGAMCSFAYSNDGRNFNIVGDTFKATPGRWVGAKLALFCIRNTQINDSGYADIDWFRLTPLK
ncbi:glycoside hydrolase 43 family protein [Mucilaginibacter sp. CSA2-8R]|uniref:glycoside hydrolase family 43 protein n=1 Tax=Mucilaginibacter sp. CSA2-8R TaxID=3141542 RepID=UPI00315DD89F